MRSQQAETEKKGTWGCCGDLNENITLAVVKKANATLGRKQNRPCCTALGEMLMQPPLEQPWSLCLSKDAAQLGGGTGGANQEPGAWSACPVEES